MDSVWIDDNDAVSTIPLHHDPKPVKRHYTLLLQGNVYAVTYNGANSKRIEIARTSIAQGQEGSVILVETY